MKKKFTFIFLCTVLFATAQVNCEEKLEKARKILDDKKLYKNYDSLFQDMTGCAETGEPLAQNYTGLMYVYGLGVEKDESKGFTYIEKAAKSGNAVGEYNLGKLYSEGRGCQLDMNKAVEWFKKAITQNNQRAAYELGYMYLKGFGVPQDYVQAVEWFKKSNYAMAKHWLGVCYYLGYGVPQNTEKALECLYGNTTPNSVAFLKNIENDKQSVVINQTEHAIKEANKAAKKIEPELISESREILISDETQNQNIKPKNILGEWTGRFIEYDWSGITPVRVLPITITFSKNDNNSLQTTIDFEGRIFKESAQLQENTLFVNDFKFKLEQLYLHDFKNDKLEYDVLGMSLSQKNVNNIPYLLVDLQSFIAYWREPGPPITLIVRPKNTVTGVDDEALLLALASQKTDFIKVYPVPFNEQLYVAFDLKQPAKINLTLTSAITAQPVKTAMANLDAGAQSFTLDTSNLPKGIYIVQIQENQKVHTKTIIKQ
ncbi:T9SS type A sorting domain-containing protein [Flavobacterium sp. FlaQc-47]|uniref:T9SS type A sorting domain-containing protein n=1 Tax=Flavobacterium sp. FlaQc-47 TaxID=3374180 RepID=UPI0037563FC2